MTQEQHSGSRSLVKDTVNWQPLTEQAINDALADNKRVFIDVTAEWCVTCKANKYNVLLRDDIQQLLSEPDVVALRVIGRNLHLKLLHFYKNVGRSLFHLIKSMAQIWPKAKYFQRYLIVNR